MIYCFTNTKGELFYYFKDTITPSTIKHRGISIKEGIIRKRLTIKVLEKLYHGYSRDFHLKFKMSRLELYSSFLDSSFFEKMGFKLLYKI